MTLNPRRAWLSLKVRLTLRWAAHYLGITRASFARDFDLRLNDSECDRFNGAFDTHTKRILLFRLDFCPHTLFHESVHAWQDQHGLDWKAAVSVAHAQATDVFNPIYDNQPHEVEANERATEMTRAAPWWLAAMWAIS